MKQKAERLRVATERGFTDITAAVRKVVTSSGVHQGVCTIFIRHTSASLVIQENADPAVRSDLEAFIDRLVPEGDPRYTHVAEGDDDMPSHIKAALTRTSEHVPVLEGGLALGTWQGVYVWEHRHGRHTREVVVHVIGE